MPDFNSPSFLPMSIVSIVPNPYPAPGMRQVSFDLSQDAIFRDGTVLDTFTAANHAGILEFVGRYGETHPAFTKNVFLGRFAFLKEYEETKYSRHANYRVTSSGVIERWIQGCRLFIGGAETVLAKKEGELAAIRARIDRISLEYLFNIKRGVISFHPTRKITHEMAANSRLVRFLLIDLEAGSSPEEFAALKKLGSKLPLPASVKKRVRTFLKRFVKIERAPEKSTGPDADELRRILGDDPFYLLVSKYVGRMEHELASDPDRVLRILCTLKRYIEDDDSPRLERHLLRLSGDNIDLYGAARELMYTRRAMEDRFSRLPGSPGIEPFYLKMLRRFSRELPVRLKEALIVYAESKFAGDGRLWRRASENLTTTAECFKEIARLVDQYLSFMGEPVFQDRRYLIEYHVYGKIAAERMGPGYKRLHVRRRLPTETLYWLLEALLEKERASLDIASCFRLIYGIGDDEWGSLLSDLVPPNIKSAGDKARKYVVASAERVTRDEIWSMIDKRGSYIRNMEAIRGLKQRRLKIHRIVLHEMMASGYDVLPHLEHIKERILRLCRDVDGADDLPDIVLDSFTTDRAVDTVRMNVTALHKVPRRIAFLVAANGRLADLLSEIEDSGKEEAIRTRVLLRLSKSPIQYTNLDKTLRRLIDDTERAV